MSTKAGQVHFARREAHERTRVYIRVLVSPVERTNFWQLAEMTGDRTPHGAQNLLARATWDADAVRDEPRTYGSKHLGDPDGILVVDETCIPNKGTKLAGVARKYCGSLGQARELPGGGAAGLCWCVGPRLP
jgi:SRSO17 transposase